MSNKVPCLVHSSQCSNIACLLGMVRQEEQHKLGSNQEVIVAVRIVLR